jgi:uncharacterized membrane protein YidH (DUF202 family)
MKTKIVRIIIGALIIALGIYTWYRSFKWLTFGNAVGFASVGVILMLAGIVIALFVRPSE